ncbi:hypothetical protein C0033_02545 [Clostridium sp. chh4-2]|nr:hypothetical protein C0033_02545 [Clostridium sp. chh4-2]
MGHVKRGVKRIFILSFIIKIIGMLILGFCAGYLCMWIRNKVLHLGFTKKENLYFAVAAGVFTAAYFIYTECR